MSRTDPAQLELAHDQDCNPSSNPHLRDILQARLTRRQALLGSASLASVSVLAGLGLVGCKDGSNSDSNTGAATSAPKLGFTAVPKSTADAVSVPPGYNVSVLYALGDPIDNATAAWTDNGSETGVSYEKRAGDHHDGMYYFGLNAAGQLDRNASDRGVLCINHEALNAFSNSTGSNALYIHANGATVAGGVRTVPDEVVKEINSHGVSVIEVRKNAAGQFEVMKGSALNRRVTAATEMDLTGPVRGADFVKTKFSTDGTRTRGTVNNCANGYTPWGTYLTCEENYEGYFARAAGDAAKRTAKENTSLSRNGKAENTRGRFLWDTAGASDDFKRWDTSVLEGQPADGTGDFRNVVNTFGWIVEVDVINPSARPKKRTALGRFAHEGAWPAKFTPGKPVVFYMGDDNRNDYIYKFVSAQNFNPADTGLTAGDKYLDSGKLYVAKFNADGFGLWLELTFGQNGLDGTNATYPFASQADVLVNARLAADKLGATKMDRPEWAAVHPVTGEVYFTLTNNRVASRPIAS
ncbi:MAG: PhoX family protein, partial [Nevskiales bacterium]